MTDRPCRRLLGDHRVLRRVERQVCPPGVAHDEKLVVGAQTPVFPLDVHYHNGDALVQQLLDKGRGRVGLARPSHAQDGRQFGDELVGVPGVTIGGEVDGGVHVILLCLWLAICLPRGRWRAITPEGEYASFPSGAFSVFATYSLVARLFGWLITSLRVFRAFRDASRFPRKRLDPANKTGRLNVGVYSARVVAGVNDAVLVSPMAGRCRRQIPRQPYSSGDVLPIS